MRLFFGVAVALLSSACTLETTLAPTKEAFELEIYPTFASTVSKSSTQTFTFSEKNFGANIVRFECSLDNLVWETCESPVTYSGLSEGRHTFSVKAIDASGEENIGGQHEWTVDTVPPVLSVDSPLNDNDLLILNSLQATLSGTCSEDGQLVTLTGAAVGVTTCTANAWNIQADVSAAVDGDLTFMVSQGDIAENYTTVSRVATKDTTAPVIAWVSPATDLEGGAAITVTWKVTEPHGSASENVILDYSGDNGSTWTVLSTQGSLNGTISAQTYNQAWTAPSASVAGAILRLRLADALGNLVTSTKTFAIDTAAPVLNSLVLADGNENVGLPSLNALLSVTPSISAISHYRISENNTFADTTWVAYTSPNLTFSLSKIGALKTVYAQVKSSAGIVSNVVSDTVTLEYGTPPVALITSPTEGGSYSPGAVMNIAWQCSSSSGSVALATNPISSIEYTVDDGVTYHVIATNQTNNDTATTGHYNWTVPAATPSGQTITGTTPIRVLVGCKTAAGIIATGLSGFQNSIWKVLIGSPGNMDYGIHLSAADMTTWTAVHGDSANNLYSGSKNGILKVNRQTGIVEQWLGNLESAGCPTHSVASFTRPRILDISNGEMTIVSGMCGTITRVKISDKSIIWNRSVPHLSWSSNQTSTEGFYHKAGYYYFAVINTIGTVLALYELNLNSISSTPKLVMGNGSSCSNTLPVVGSVSSTLQIHCTLDSNWWNVSYDRQKIFIYSVTGSTTNQVTLTFNSTTANYEVTAVGTATAPCTRTVMIGNDASKYYCIRHAGQGRNVTYFDTATNQLHTTHVTLSTFNNLGNMQMRLGSSDSAAYVISGVTNEIFEVKHTGTAWEQSNIGGTPLFTYGNGTDPTKVAFTSLAGLAYDPVNKFLYTRGINHIRRMKVDTTTTPATPFISLIETGMSTNAALSNSGSFGGIAVNKTGTAIVVNQSVSPVYYWKALDLTTWNSGASTVGGGQIYLNGGTTAAYPTLGTSFAYNAGVNLQDWGSTATFLSDGKLYFVGSSNDSWDQNLWIFQSSGPTTITSVAGATGAAGYSSIGGGGATALGTPLTRIYGMQSATNNDLLVFDAHRLRRVSVVTESGAPKVYDEIDFSTFTNYPGNLPWVHAVQDTATGWNYFVVNEDTATGRATQVWAARAAEGFVQIPITGLKLTGIQNATRGKGLGLEVTPLGLLLLDTPKKRILTTPLKPL
ncbi:hypothetical protein [Bdellovibrio reynosensis]|uniref:Uncharacterized protein n=1 Tax=Bdellovibrio reynosensis TaxID=2835041 RepID=A0ABY4CF72_9BACT|nr:hypothetical protein [Bdellovibrio reynosensis]UOF02537.1 hypothetical protein MNR06_06175 [Bdellovibrio reynosensis]